MICPNCNSHPKGNTCLCGKILYEAKVKPAKTLQRSKTPIKKVKHVSDKTHLQKIEDDLWDIFSVFIRRRDAKKFSGGEIGKCVTCSHVDRWKYMQAGHFISRKQKATKFEEKNNNLQCGGCNGPKSGMQFEHGKAIDRMYGKGTADMLLMKSKNITKWGVFELELMIKMYKSKIKSL